MKKIIEILSMVSPHSLYCNPFIHNILLLGIYMHQTRTAIYCFSWTVVFHSHDVYIIPNLDRNKTVQSLSLPFKGQNKPQSSYVEQCTYFSEFFILTPASEPCLFMIGSYPKAVTMDCVYAQWRGELIPYDFFSKKLSYLLMQFALLMKAIKLNIFPGGLVLSFTKLSYA